MPNLTRTEMIWKLLGDEHPNFCIARYGFSPDADILILPKERPLSSEALAAKTFFEKLNALSDKELAGRIAEAERAKAVAEEAAHPFNRPEAVADRNVYDYWSKAAYWTREEGAALLLERDPRQVIRKTRTRHEKLASFKPSSCGARYEALYNLVCRAARAKQLYGETRPGTFIAWAKRNRIEVPELLEAAVKAHGLQVADWKTAYDRKVAEIAALKIEVDELRNRLASNPPPDAEAVRPSDLSTRERNTLLKIILGLAISSYRHDPHSSRTGTATAMSEELMQVGLSVSDDTIRKYLHEAAEFAPPRETE